MTHISPVLIFKLRKSYTYRGGYNIFFGISKIRGNSTSLAKWDVRNCTGKRVLGMERWMGLDNEDTWAPVPGALVDGPAMLKELKRLR